MGNGRKDNQLLMTILAIVGIIVLALAVLYAVYRFFAPMYYMGYDEEAGELPQEEPESDRAEADSAEKAEQNG